MVDIDNTIADYTNGLRDYIRECGHGEDECPCPEPTAYDFTLTGGWPFTLGLHDVNYHSDSYYTENFVAEKEAYGESCESLKIDGTGFDVKAGN